MSGIEIFGLLAGIVSVMEVIIHTYDAIKDFSGLPEAFHAVGRRLPLIEKTLQDAKRQAKESKDPEDWEGEDPEALKTLVEGCCEKIKDLKNIFEKLSRSKGKSILQAYRTLVIGIGKSGRVESLMGDILMDVQTLTSCRVFKTATQDQVEELKKAIQEINQVDPSLPDSLFEEKTASSIHYGQGDIKNYSFSDSSTQTNVSGNMSSFNAKGDMTIGDGNDHRFLKDLRITDPEDDKACIEDNKGPEGRLLRDSYSWILENDDFKEWRDGESRLLWISGGPGKGKTMSICGIIDELSPSTMLKDQNSNTVLSYFFCDASDSSKNTAPSVLRGILYLLARQKQSSISQIMGKYRTSGQELFEGKNAWQAVGNMMRNALTELRSQKTYLLIDAIDECRHGWQQLLRFVKETSWPHVKWIVSSRNKPDIAEVLETAPHRVRLCLELNESAVSTAVNSYIQYQVDDLAEKKGYNCELKHAVQHHLSSKAQNTFLWVSLACQMLEKTFKFETLRKLEEFPPGLNPLYGRMLEQLRSDEEHRVDLYRKVVSLMLTVFRPISLDELGALADFADDACDDRSLTEIIGLCGSFLTLKRRTVCFVHESAKDFLMNSTEEFRNDGKEQHRHIFLRSLLIMSGSLRRDIYGLESAKPPDKNPLAPLQYSCTCWVLHLTNCGSDARNQEIADNGPVDKFLRQHYLHWLEALGYMKAIPAGLVGITMLEGILQKHTSQLAKLVQDEAQFMQYHRGAIKRQPLQVYASALLFSPTRSITREIYQEEKPKWITTSSAMGDNWSACLQTMESGSSDISCIAFSHDGQLLVGACEDKTAKIWHMIGGECIRILSGHTGRLTSIDFSGSDFQIASASEDHTVKVWDAERGRCEWTLQGHTDVVNSVAFSQDGSLVASGSADKTIKLWDLKTGTCKHTLHKHTEGVRSVVFSRDGQYLASASDNFTHVWDLKSETYRLTFSRSHHHFSPLTFSPDGKLVMIVSQKVELRNPATGECINEIDRNSLTPIDSIASSRDNSLLASSSETGSIIVLDTTTKDCVQRFEEGAVSVAFSPTSHLLASAQGPRIKIWDLAISTSVQANKVQRYFDIRLPQRISCSPNGSWVAALPGDRTVRLWDSATGKCLYTFDFLMAQSPVFSPDSRLLAIFNFKFIEVRDAATGKKIHSLMDKSMLHIDKSMFIEMVAVSHDNRWLVSSSKEGMMNVWDLKIGERIRKLKALGGDNRSLVFSPDGRYLAVGSNKSIELWDLTKWKHKRTFKGTVGAHAMVFSNDSCWLASSASHALLGYTEIKIWEVKEGKCTNTFRLTRSCVVQAFDQICLHVETTAGTFELDRGSSQMHLKGYGLDPDYQWIVWGQGRSSDKYHYVLWLPPEYRPFLNGFFGKSAIIFGSKVAIGRESGEVLIVEFEPDGPLTRSTSQQQRASFPTPVRGHLEPFHLHRTLSPSQRRLSEPHSLD